jgi:MFS family permease
LESQNINRIQNKKTGIFYGYKIVGICYIVTLIVWGSFNSFGVLFDSLLNEFHWSRAMTSGGFFLCMTMSGVAAIPVGKIVDKFGPRAVMMVCSLLFGGGFILMSQVNAVWQFYLVYGIVIGVGMAGFWVPVLTTVARWFVRKRGLMVGIVATGTGVGTIIFPPLINWLISQYQWRLSMVIVGILGLAVGLVLSYFIVRDPAKIGQYPDGQPGELKTENNDLTSGIFLREAAGTLQFWLVILIFFSCGFCTYTVLVHLVSHVLTLGISSATGAFFLSLGGGISIISGILSGITVDKIGIRKSLAIFLFITLASSVWLILARETWQFWIFAIIFGFAWGSFPVLETVIVVWLFGLKANGIILSIIDMGLVMGASTGPLAAGYVFDKTGNYYLAFIITAVLLAAGLLLTVLVRPPRTAQNC